MLLLSGGELTVTLQGKGQGKAAAGRTRNTRWRWRSRSTAPPGIAALAGDTDGTDGGVGRPDDPAGAFVDEHHAYARPRARPRCCPFSCRK